MLGEIVIFTISMENGTKIRKRSLFRPVSPTRLKLPWISRGGGEALTEGWWQAWPINAEIMRENKKHILRQTSWVFLSYSASTDFLAGWLPTKMQDGCQYNPKCTPCSCQDHRSWTQKYPSDETWLLPNYLELVINTRNVGGWGTLCDMKSNPLWHVLHLLQNKLEVRNRVTKLTTVLKLV